MQREHMTVDPNQSLSSGLLVTDELSKRFGSFIALRPVSFELRAGDIVTLSGPNGSGKSTLLQCLSGLLRPTSGRVYLQGYDLYRQEREARRRLAYVPDVPVFYQELTAWEHLRFMALAHSAQDGFEERAESLLNELGLWEARDLFPQAYSRGMRLKLGLALALIRPFKVLLLDEPNSALDTESTQALGERLRRLAQDGAAVLLTTHDPHFAEQLQATTWRMTHGYIDFDDFE